MIVTVGTGPWRPAGAEQAEGRCGGRARAEFEQALLAAAPPGIRVDVSYNRERRMYRNPHVESRWLGWCLAKGISA